MIRVKKLRIGYLIGIMSLSSSLFVGCNLIGKDKEKQLPEETKTEQTQNVIDVDGKMIAGNTESIVIDFPAGIEAVLVKEGQKVQQGDVLMTLDLESYNNQLSLKENELEIAKIKLAQLQQTANPQVATLTQLTNTLTREKSKLHSGTDEEIQTFENSLALAANEQKVAEEDYAASQELVAVGGISEKELQDLEQVVTQKIKAVLNLNLQIKQLKEAKNTRVDDLEAQIQSQQAQLSNIDSNKASEIAIGTKQVESLELVIEHMKTQLSQDFIKGNQIIAPSEGLIVTAVMAEKGMQTQQLVGPAITFADEKSLSVEIEIPEEYIGDIKIGQEVEITPVGLKEKILKGKITTLSYQVEESFGENMIKAEVSVDEGIEGLRLGQSIEAQILSE